MPKSKDHATVPGLKAAVAVFDHINWLLKIDPESVDESVKDGTVIQLAHMIDRASGLPEILRVCWSICAKVEKHDAELYRELRTMLLTTEPKLTEGV